MADNRPGQFLLYGATGYTAGLIAGLAGQYDLQPILAGRDGPGVTQTARAHHFDHRVFALDTTRAVQAGLKDVQVVLNCAGPFAHTYKPLVNVCIDRGIHYVDITGEIMVLEALAARDGEAQVAGVLLLPGAGFDVVPTDCMAAHLKRRLPAARSLMLGIAGTGRLSRGTKTTMVEHQHLGGMVRRDGRIVQVPAAWKTRQIDFGTGPRTTITIPWGDVATAYHTTAIPNIEVYAAAPRMMRAGLRLSRHFGWLTAQPAVKSILRRMVRAGEPGPTQSERVHGRSFVWGRAEDGDGNAVEARSSGPEGYTLTAHSAVLAVKKILQGAVKPGFQTPALAFGADFVLEIPGTERTDIPAS
jgi:short subunit dehydrogenase-like uncharacterized protein